MSDAVYCFDASALVHAATRAYPIELFGSFWEKLEAVIDANRAIAPDEVLNEIERKDDALHAWCKARKRFFLPLSVEIQVEAAAITAEFPSLVDLKKGRGVADPFVIAAAKVNGAIVVSQEFAKPTRPRIPDACRHYRIPCISLLEMIRTERWRF